MIGSIGCNRAILHHPHSSFPFNVIAISIDLVAFPVAWWWRQDLAKLCAERMRRKRRALGLGCSFCGDHAVFLEVQGGLRGSGDPFLTII